MGVKSDRARRAGRAAVVIGLDLGTSTCKALAFGLDGRRLAAARAVQTVVTAGVRSEQSPQQWIAGVRTCLADVARQLGGVPVAGIGLSGQIGTHLLVDQAMRPLADAVTWQDGRSGGCLPEVAAAVPQRWLAEQLSTWLPPGATWPLPRMAWYATAYPALVERARYLLSPKDYVVWWLTGTVAADAASWRGIARPDGSVVDEALRRLGLPDLVPPLAPPQSVAGGLTPAAADAVGLPAGTPVVVGLNDLNAALIGLGAGRVGGHVDVGGTSEHIGVIAAAPAGDWRLASVPLHGIDLALYATYGVTSNAGSVVAWLEKSFLRPGEDLFGLAGSAEPGARGLVCLPYLHGERAPIWDAEATGAFVGLTNWHERPDFVRAALEGVACNLRAIWDLLPALPDCHQPVLTTGGTAGSAWWNSVKAAVLGRPLQTFREPEAASLGAAVLAAVGTSLVGSTRDGCAAMVHPGDLVEPDPALVRTYQEVYPRYRRAAAYCHNLRRTPGAKGSS